MEASGQDVDEEAADELVAGQHHDFVPLPALGAVVLPPEGDAGVVAGYEAAVGDGNAVDVTRQVCQHRFMPGEGPLDIEDPLDRAQRCQISAEGRTVGGV